MNNYPHQEEVFQATKNRTYYALFWEMGLGKSKTFLDTVMHLHKEGEIDRALILAPKGVYMNWVDDQIPKHGDMQVTLLAYWKSDASNKERRMAESLIPPAEDSYLRIIVMNTEALGHGKRAAEFASKYLHNGKGMIVLDESTSIKNPTAKCTKTLMRLRDLVKYRRIGSGTPITQSPLDLYTQAKFLSPATIAFSSYYAFRGHFAEMQRMTYGARSFNKIVKYRNLQELTPVLQRWASRLKKEECLDLPEKTFMDHFVPHTEIQAKYYQELKDEALILLDDNNMVSVTSALTTMMKLHQINCGHVITDDGTSLTIENNRISGMMELITLAPKKVIIWCHFRQDIRNVSEALRREYGNESVAEYYGETDANDRRISIDRFNNDPTCRFFVASRAAAKGLTLVVCHYVIYFSYDWSLETWLQSQDRNHRIGQVNNVTYIVIQTKGTIDIKLIKALKAKIDLSSSVLDDWRGLLK